MNISNNIDLGNLIIKKLKEKQRSISWLAKQIGFDNSNLRKILKSTRYLTPELIYSISEVLEEDFFACYSERLKENSGQIDQ